MRFIHSLTLAAAMLLQTPGASAAPGSQKSTVVTKAESGKTGLTFTFRVVPEAKLHINQEGPWQLELLTAPGLTFASTTLKKNVVDFGLPGFTAMTTMPPSLKSGSLAYKLIAFVCTDDKALCFRDVHTGEINWKK